MSLPVMPRTAAGPQAVLSVSDLTQQIKELLEPAFTSVWVGGEISNFSRHRSGHVYLTLKDERAQIGAIIWRGQAERIRFELHDGLEVIIRGHLSLYEPRGEYRLIVQRIQPKGMGALELAFRQLKEKLEKEGLFDPQFKKPLPRFPRRVVLVTSPTGAAVRDLLQVMRRRWPAMEIWVRPVRVQGDGAAAEITAALRQVDQLPGIDVAVLARGGGSLEDLWAFNEEPLVRAIFAMKTPVVSAVGHEINVTLSDLVADRRALTPSEAGEIVAPDRQEVGASLDSWRRRLTVSLGGRVDRAGAQLRSLLLRPMFRRPYEGIYQRERLCDELLSRTRRATVHRLRDAEHRLGRLAAAMESLSPLRVLGRGYSLTFQEDGRTLLCDAASVTLGERVVTRLERGRLVSRIEEILPQ